MDSPRMNRADLSDSGKSEKPRGSEWKDRILSLANADGVETFWARGQDVAPAPEVYERDGFDI